MVNTSVLLEFVELDKEKKRLKARLKEIEERQRELQYEEGGLIDQIAAAMPPEVDKPSFSMKVGNTTVYLHTQAWAKPLKSREELVEALKRNGYDHLVKEDYNATTLSSIVREWINEGGIPDELSDVLGVDMRLQLRTRGA